MEVYLARAAVRLHGDTHCRHRTRYTQPWLWLVVPVCRELW